MSNAVKSFQVKITTFCPVLEMWSAVVETWIAADERGLAGSVRAYTPHGDAVDIVPHLGAAFLSKGQKKRYGIGLVSGEGATVLPLTV